MNDFGKRMRFMREATGQTLRDVEKATGISNAYLSQLETGSAGHESLSLGKAIAIANHFGVSVGAMAGVEVPLEYPMWFLSLGDEERSEVEAFAAFLVWKRGR